jgi:hypothetical protein
MTQTQTNQPQGLQGGLIGSELVILHGLIEKSNLDDLRYIQEAVIHKKNLMSKMNKLVCEVGDVVFVNHPKLANLKCTILKINRTKILVSCPLGKFSIPPVLIYFQNQ